MKYNNKRYFKFKELNNIMLSDQNSIVSCIAAKGYYFERDAQYENVTYFSTRVNDKLYIMVSNDCLSDFVKNHPNGPGTAAIGENFGKVLFLRRDSAFKNHLGKIGDYWDIKNV